MSNLSAGEQARRAMGRSLQEMTELITVTDNDPQDQDANPARFIVEPNDVFTFTFSRIGLMETDDTEELRLRLAKRLPTIAQKIADMSIGPPVRIELVIDFLARELDVVDMGGEGN